MNIRNLSKFFASLLITMLVLAFLPPPAASAAEAALDQSQTVVGDTSWNIGRVAQTFTAGTTGGLDKVSLHVGTSAADTLTVQIQDVASGKPNGTVLATSTVSFSAGTPGQWVDCTFVSPPTVFSGTQYAIVILSATTKSHLDGTSVGDAYPLGEALGWSQDNSRWYSYPTDLGNNDLGFKTYVNPVVLDQSQTVVGDTSWNIGRVAQTFTAGTTGGLDKVSLHVGTSAADTLTVQIQDVASGKPNGTVLATSTVSFSAGTPGQWVDCTFVSPPTVFSGTQYAIVILSATTKSHLDGTSVGDAYPLGEALGWSQDNSRWYSYPTDLGNNDLGFKTYVVNVRNTYNVHIDLTGTGGQVAGSPKLVNNPAGSTVTLTASSLQPGIIFSKWESADITIADPAANPLAFTMPARDITVRAYFVAGKMAGTVTLGDMTQDYTGSALTPTATTNPPGLAVTWTGAPQTNAGSYPVTATINDANYEGSASGTFIIYNNRPFASFTASPNPAAPGQSITFDASASAHGRPDRSIVGYAWDFGDGGTASGKIVTYAYSLFGTFTATLTVTDNNVPAKTATATTMVTISQGNQPPVANAGGPYTVDLGGTVTLNGSGSSDPNAAAGDFIVYYQWSIDSGTLTLSGVNPALSSTQTEALGSGVRTVSLTVTDSFGATGTASTTLTVSKAPASVTLSNLTQTYTGSALTPTATTNPPGLAVTWTGAPQTNAGSYPVTATITDANYQGSATGTFTINKAASLLFTESFNADTNTLPGPYATSGFALNQGTGRVSSGRLTLNGGHTQYLQTFTRPGFSGDVTVAGKVTGPSYGDYDMGMVFGNRLFVFHPGYSGGAFRIETMQGSFGGVLVPNVGMGFTPSPTTFTTMQIEWRSGLNQVKITIGTFVYNWTPDAEFNPAGAVGFIVENGNNSVNPAYFDDLTVALPLVTLSNLTQTYTGSPLTPTATTSPSGLSVTWTGVPQTNAGSYAVTATIDDANYQGSATGTFTINKAPATITLSNLNHIYDGSPKSATATTNPSGLAVGIVYNDLDTPPTGTGSYEVTAYVNDSNYQGGASGTLLIARATPVLTWANPADIVFGTALSGTQLNATASVPGTFVYSPAAGTVLNAGTGQTLSTTFTPTDTANYNNVAKGAIINVLKADQTITFTTPPPASAAYNTSFTVAATATSGLPVAYSSSLPLTNSGGTYTMTSGTGVGAVRADQAGSANYNPAPQVSFSVAALKVGQSITLGSLVNKTYGDQPFTVSASASSGLPVSLSISGPATLSGSTVTITGAGEIKVTVSQAGNDNYTPAPNVEASMTINPRPLTVKADNKTKIFGAALPAFTAIAAGLANGDTLSSLGTLQFTTTAVPNSPAGAYSITPAGLTSPNYTYTYVDGTLTIIKADTTVVVSSSKNPAVFGEPVTFTATISVVAPGAGSPGGTVDFKDGTTTIATSVVVSGNVASFTTSSLTAGSHTISAVYNGNANLNGSTSAVITQTARYTFIGFLPPLNDKNNKQSGVIPIKWQLTDARGSFIGDLGSVKSLLVGPVGGALAAPDASGNTALRYDATANQYVFNWQTKGLKAGNYTVNLGLSDGTTHTASVTLK